MAHDQVEGWAHNDQIGPISEGSYLDLESLEEPRLSADLISHIQCEDGLLMPVPLGSSVGAATLLHHGFDGSCQQGKKPKHQLVDTAFLYLKAPFLSGGRSPFGIDCSGFTQMVHKINGYALERKAQGQAGQGVALSFIEESEAGDLAFFDDRDGTIDHVGMILEENHIIHVDGHVRIDRLDHTGIFNREKGTYTHKLRVIKKIV